MSKDEKKLGKELSADQLDDVAGGGIYSFVNNYDHTDYGWEVIDDETGNVVYGTSSSYEDACKWAMDHGYRTTDDDWQIVVELRESNGR